MPPRPAAAAPAATPCLHSKPVHGLIHQFEGLNIGKESEQGTYRVGRGRGRRRRGRRGSRRRTAAPNRAGSNRRRRRRWRRCCCRCWWWRPSCCFSLPPSRGKARTLPAAAAAAAPFLGLLPPWRCSAAEQSELPSRMSEESSGVRRDETRRDDRVGEACCLNRRAFRRVLKSESARAAGPRVKSTPTP